MSIIYVTVLDVIALNAKLLHAWHQEASVLNEAALEGALMRPQMAAHYEEADLLLQAALLIDGIARAHAFVDGNKRTAMAAGTIFLDINGCSIVSENQGLDLGQQIEALVTHAITFEVFVAWLRERLRPLG
jgi:death-on-curing protein